MKHKVITKILLTALCLLSSFAWARTTWYVNGVSGSDTNNCLSATTACKTIRHAISLASSGDSIVVAAATYSENLNIALSLKITGASASATIIDGGHRATVVTISNHAGVTLANLTIRNGTAKYGGGINTSGALTVTNSIIRGNTAAGSPGRGGGIYNTGTLTINSSTLSQNAASGYHCVFYCAGGSGGAIDNEGTLTVNYSTLSGNSASSTRGGSSGGGIVNDGTLSLNNSSVSGNSASSTRSSGGGIENTGTASISNSTLSGNTAVAIGGAIESPEGSTLMINNSTLSRNSAGAGGAISTYNAPVILQNSIVANNNGGDCDGTMTSNGYNLSSDSTCNFNGPGDLNNTEPMLGPLANNGGPTQTMALLSGSPAIDAGNPSGCTDGQGHLLKTDQRGMPRPDPEDTSGCDMGAYERQSD